jgi:hypothetical protein
VHDLVEHRAPGLRQRDSRRSAEEPTVGCIEPSLEPVRRRGAGGVDRQRRLLEERRQQERRVGVSKESGDGPHAGEPGPIFEPRQFPHGSAFRQRHEYGEKRSVRQQNVWPLRYRRRPDDGDERDVDEIHRHRPVDGQPGSQPGSDDLSNRAMPMAAPYAKGLPGVDEDGFSHCWGSGGP